RRVPGPRRRAAAPAGRGPGARPRGAAAAHAVTRGISPPGDRAALRQRYEQRLKLMVPADVAQLKSLSLFAGIPEKAREKVIEKARKYIHFCTYTPGEVVLREGDYGDSAF